MRNVLPVRRPPKAEALCVGRPALVGPQDPPKQTPPIFSARKKVLPVPTGVGNVSLSRVPGFVTRFNSYALPLEPRSRRAGVFFGPFGSSPR